MPRPFTLRSSHLLMWSSPLLLLVLVFTITSRPLHPSASTTSLAHTTTTATAGRPTTTTTTTTSTTSTTSTTTVTPATTTTTTTSIDQPTTTRAGASDVSTTTSVVASELVDGGRLDLAHPNEVVPLGGPGQWSLTSSEPVVSTLICAGHGKVVATTFRLAAGQTCQLNIVVDTGAPTQWALNAVR